MLLTEPFLMFARQTPPRDKKDPQEVGRSIRPTRSRGIYDSPGVVAAAPLLRGVSRAVSTAVFSAVFRAVSTPVTRAVSKAI